MVKRNVKVLSFCLILLLFTSCRGTSTPIYEKIKTDFAQYEASNDVALVLYNSRLYFYDYTLDLEKILPGEVFDFRYATLMNDTVYFVVALKDQHRAIFSTVLYQCDLYGNNLEMLYKKEKLEDLSFVEFNSGIFYFKHYESGMQILETYNCLDRRQEVLESQESFDLNEYVKSFRLYDIEKNEDGLVITRKGTTEQRIIDSSIIKNSELHPLLEKYDYERVNISTFREKIILTYRLRIEGFFEIPDGYPFVIFEYDFETSKLTFLSIVYSYDCESYEIQYNFSYGVG